MKGRKEGRKEGQLLRRAISSLDLLRDTARRLGIGRAVPDGRRRTRERTGRGRVETARASF